MGLTSSASLHRTWTPLLSVVGVDICQSSCEGWTCSWTRLEGPLFQVWKVVFIQGFQQCQNNLSGSPTGKCPHPPVSLEEGGPQ